MVDKAEKKVERSGRRGRWGCWVVVGTLCSTEREGRELGCDATIKTAGFVLVWEGGAYLRRWTSSVLGGGLPIRSIYVCR